MKKIRLLLILPLFVNAKINTSHFETIKTINITNCTNVIQQNYGYSPNTYNDSIPILIEGCMDTNASNFNADATEAGFDQYGNSLCVYASCDDIPEYGCIYGNGFGPFNADFSAAQCSQYGGSPCEEPSSDVVGCMDSNASNYDSLATVQGYDQYNNLQCVYASCDDIPEWGCIYADGFGSFNAEFGASACSSYGGSPCEEPACAALDFTAENTGF